MPSLARVMPVISFFIVLFPYQSFILTRFLHVNRYPPRIKPRGRLSLEDASVARHTILGVTVAVIFEHLLDNLGLEFSVGAFCDLGEIKVLDRIAVGVELETAAQRGEVRLLQRGRHGIL